MLLGLSSTQEASRPDCIRARIDHERAKASTLNAELEALTEELDGLRLHLRARGISDTSVTPSQMKSGEQPENNLNELRDFIAWVAERVDWSQEVVFNVGGEVKVGSTDVYLGRFVRWELSNCGGQRLSVPYDMRVEVANLLAEAHAARSRGSGVDSAIDIEGMHRHWEMVCAEITTGSRAAVPAVFLVHVVTRRAMVVGAWPRTKSDAEPKPKLLPQFDPEKHFRRPLAAIVQASTEQPASETRDAEDSTDAADHAQAASIITVRRAVSVGDRVEIKYKGQWFSGVLQCVDGDLANVQCDVDLPGLITVAPLANVRLTQFIPVPCRTPR